MKKKSILALGLVSALGVSALSLTLGLGLGSAKGAEAEGTYDTKELISYFALPYHVEGSATQSYAYPTQYAGLDYTNSYSLYADYGYLTVDGESVQAVRDSSGLVHYAGEDGAATYDTLSSQNEVVSVEERYLGARVLYSETYREPWAYLDYDDIDASTLEVDPAKATFLIESYFGVSVGVQSCYLTLDNGVPSGLNLTFTTRYDGLEEGDDDTGSIEILYITETFDASVSFSFSVDPIASVSPATNSNPDLQSAFENPGDNFTLHVSSNQISSTIVYYVTDSGILLHLDSSTSGLVDGDTYYAYNSTSGRYSTYTYTSSTATWSRGSNASYTDILPDFSSVSSAIFTQESTNIYAMVSEAVSTAPLSFVVPYYSESFEEATGVSNYITLSDGMVSQVSSSFSLSGTSVTLAESFSSRGSTSFPGYFDVNAIA